MRLKALILIFSLTSSVSAAVPAAAGTVDDRLTIVNQVQAFPHLLDSMRLEEWAELFTDDVVFEAHPPSGERLVIRTKEALLAVFVRRYREGFAAAQIQRRHAVSTIHVIEQTKTAAHIEAYVTISVVREARELAMVVTGTYEIFFAKDPNGAWLINRMIVRPDANRGEHTPPVEVPDAVKHLVEKYPAD